jgi:GT2 family glycosyltransferase
MPTSKPVLAICVNFNGGDVLLRTVESLLKSRYDKLKVLVVDNASSDDSLSGLPRCVQVVRLERNLGYGGAINEVVRPLLEEEQSRANGRISPRYFLLLNDDVLAGEKTIRSLVDFAEEKGPGIYGPRIVQYSHPDRLEAAWGELSWSHVLAHYAGKGSPKSQSRWSRPTRVSLLLGSFLLVHRQVFEKTGLFDSGFFMYHEEVDFLYRAGRRGFPAYFCPHAEVQHRGAYSTRGTPLKKVYWIRRNTVFFFRKHRASFWKWCYYFLTLGLSLLFNTATFRWVRAKTILRAVKEGFFKTAPKTLTR